MKFRPRIPPLTFPDNCNDGSRCLVLINYPGYAHDSLLKFIHYGEGIDYDLVIYTCCIVAGNTWPLEMIGQPRNITRADGGKLSYVYLSLSRKPNVQNAVICPNNSILTKRSYFLHNIEGDIHYPFMANFNHWIFPHDDIPPPWQAIPVFRHLSNELLDNWAITISRNETCRITNSYTPLERAHIIPSSEHEWYRVNAMHFYSGANIDALENSLTLRKDVHHLWDKKMGIILFPRQHEGTYHLVSHAFKTCPASNMEVEQQYHNLECQELYNVRREYLFARFAWSIFHGDTVTLHKSKKGVYRLLLSVEDVEYPKAKVEDVSFTGQIPLRSLFYANLPDLGQPSKKRSLSRADKNSRGYYCISDQIIHLERDSNNSDTIDNETTNMGIRGYYFIGDQIIHLDNDTESVLSNAVDIDDNRRIGRKRQRSESFGSESTPLSQSLITVSSGGWTDSSVANPFVLKPEKNVGSKDHGDVTGSIAIPKYQVAMHNAESVQH
ncbi:hypothetical protein F4814DRAFT_421468 [Daldinia grandis]|nr:hypothetical protein F4814DRAFT_421468 [Daldinia grandis]